MSLPDDYGFVPGRSTETAVKLLKLAEENDIDPSLVGALTRNPDGSGGGGYQVPNELLDLYNEYLENEGDVIEPQNSDGLDDESTDEEPAAAIIGEASEAPEGEQHELIQIPGGGEVEHVEGSEGEQVPGGESEEGEAHVNPVAEPPKSGAGSGIQHWQDFAKGSGAWTDADAELTRTELIEKYATVPVETPAE